MPSSMETVRESVVNLLGGVVDYAGLFPPAKLEMRPTCENFAEYLGSEHEWMLGRLIVPVSRLGEFEKASADLLARGEDAENSWLISALVGDDLEADIDAIFEFNERHAPEDEGGDGASNGFAVVDVIEARASSTREIDSILTTVPEQLEAFIEIPWDGEIRGLVAAIGGDSSSGASAKIRTGHVNPELIPSCEVVARFIATCAQAGVPFKATAGLHHPIRAEYALTYEPDSPRAVLHGYLNVFAASAIAHAHRIDEPIVRAILEETDASVFDFQAGTLRWGEFAVTSEQLVASRERFAISFGSCSFTEPTQELAALGLLE